MDSVNVAGFDKLPKITQNVLNKLGAQIEALVPPADQSVYEEVAAFLVTMNPEQYVDGDMPARHLAACLVTYFTVGRR